MESVSVSAVGLRAMRFARADVCGHLANWGEAMALRDTLHRYPLERLLISKVNGDRGRRVSWMSLLRHLHENWAATSPHLHGRSHQMAQS
jgi:hypothetical protein